MALLIMSIGELQLVHKFLDLLGMCDNLFSNRQTIDAWDWKC